MSNVSEMYTVKMKSKIKDMADALMEASETAFNAHAEYGYTEYIEWIETEIGLSEWYGKVFLNLHRRFLGVVMPAMPNTILMFLAQPSTPDEAVEEIKEIFESGKSVTVRGAKDIIQQHKEEVRSLALDLRDKAPEQIQDRVLTGDLSVKNAHGLMTALEGTTETVRTISLAYAVSDPDVIPVLEKLEQNDPDELASIAATGHFQAGKVAIPLSDANGRDADDTYAAIRYQTQQAGYEANQEILVRSDALCVAVDPLTNRVTFQIDDVSELSTFVQGFLRFSVPIKKEEKV